MIDGLDKALGDTELPGLHELRGLLQDLLGGPTVEGRFLGHSDLKPKSTKIFRLRFSVNGDVRTWVVKRIRPAIARRSELVARRWLPAVGLTDLGPALAGSVADPRTTCVWQVYHDLGPHELDPSHPSKEAIRAAVELIAQVHTRFAGHALLGEVRLHGGDLGLQFLESNVRDAIYALEALRADAQRKPLIDRLLQRLYMLRHELPERGRLLEKWGGPETVLHGDLWAINVFIIKTDDGVHARLIDWDHVAVGQFSYDLSTFLLRFAPKERQSILDLYGKEVARSNWNLPGRRELNALFETAEYARFANRIIWPGIALVMDKAEWGFKALEDIEQWFEKFEPVLPG